MDSEASVSVSVSERCIRVSGRFELQLRAASAVLVAQNLFRIVARSDRAIAG
jgi:hypothetical protein